MPDANDRLSGIDKALGGDTQQSIPLPQVGPEALDDIDSVLDTISTRSLASDPAPISIRRIANRGAFLNGLSTFNRATDGVGAEFPGLGIFNDEESLSEGEFETLGGKDLGMEFFDGVRPSDIEIFKARKFLEFLNTQAQISDGTSKDVLESLSDLGEQLALDLLYNPVSWAAILTGGALSVGARAALLRAGQGTLFKSALFNDLAVSAASEAIVSVPFTAAQIDFLTDDPNNEISFDTAVEMFTTNATFSAVLGPSVVGFSRVFKAGLDRVGRKVGGKFEDVRDASAAAREDMAAAHEELGSPDPAVTYAAAEQAVDSLDDIDTAISDLNKIDDAASKLSDAELSDPNIVAPQQPGGTAITQIDNQGSLSRIRERADTFATALPQDAAETIAQADETLALLLSSDEAAPAPDIDAAAMTFGRAISVLESLGVLSDDSLNIIGVEFVEQLRDLDELGGLPESLTFADAYEMVADDMGSLIAQELSQPLVSNITLVGGAEKLGVRPTTRDAMMLKALSDEFVEGITAQLSGRSPFLEQILEFVDFTRRLSTLRADMLRSILPKDVVDALPPRAAAKLGKAILRELKSEADALAVADGLQSIKAVRNLRSHLGRTVSRLDFQKIFATIAETDPGVPSAAIGVIRDKAKAKVDSLLPDTEPDGTISPSYWKRDGVAETTTQLSTTLRMLGVTEGELSAIMKHPTLKALTKGASFKLTKGSRDKLPAILEDVLGENFVPLKGTVKTVDELPARDAAPETSTIEAQERSVLTDELRQYAEAHNIPIDEVALEKMFKSLDDILEKPLKTLKECDI